VPREDYYTSREAPYAPLLLNKRARKKSAAALAVFGVSLTWGWALFESINMSLYYAEGRARNYIWSYVRG
jgi:hypothetical protein